MTETRGRDRRSGACANGRRAALARAAGGRGERHPRDLEAGEVRGFLTYLAAERNVAAATQNQALRFG